MFRKIEAFGRRLARRKRVAVFVVVIALLVVRVGMLVFYPAPVPIFQDEFSYLLAGDTFAHGRLANPTPPFPVFFDTIHELFHPTYASMYPPAQGFALAIGQVLGHPWIGVILSMAAFFAALLWMLQGWLPPGWALIGAVLVFVKLGVFSYWMNSYWGGAVAALGGALVIGALPRIVRKPKIFDSLAMGIGVAILANSRPYEGAITCVPVFVALCIWLFKKKRVYALSTGIRNVVAPLGMVLVATAGFMLYYNWRVTQEPLVMPHALDDQQHLSVSDFVWGHRSPEMQYANHQFDVFYNHFTRNQFSGTFEDFLRITKQKGWDFFRFYVGPALLIPLLAVPWFLRDQRSRLLLVQLVCYCCGAVCVAFFHPHYAAPVIATFYGLDVQLFRHLSHWKLKGRPFGVGVVRGAMVILVASFTVNFVTLVRDPRASAPLGWGYTGNWDRARVVSELEAIAGNHLVIVNYSFDHHNINLEWVYNDARIDQSRIVWVRDIPGMDLRPLLVHFAGRKVWIVSPDTPNPEPIPYESPVQLHQLEEIGAKNAQRSK